MKIICSACQQDLTCPPGRAVLGEKCPRCGSAELTKIDPPVTVSEFKYGMVFLTRQCFVCWPCRYIFPSGEGPDSHTLCDFHVARARADAGLAPKQPTPQIERVLAEHWVIWDLFFTLCKCGFLTINRCEHCAHLATALKVALDAEEKGGS